MYEFNKMNLSGTDIDVKDSSARQTAETALTTAENASGIATQALTNISAQNVRFATLEATADTQGLDITTLKNKVGTGTLNTGASTLIPAVNEVNNGLTVNNAKLYHVGADHRESVSVLEYAKTAAEGITFFANSSGSADNPASTGSFAFIVIRFATGRGIFALPTGGYTIYSNRSNDGGVTWSGWRSVALS